MNFKKLVIIIGIAENKDCASILRSIIPKADHVFITRFQNKERKCADPNKLAKISKPFLKKSAVLKTFLDPNQTLHEAQKIARRDDAILVTGSFFLAGEMRRNWFSEEQILKSRKSFDPKK